MLAELKKKRADKIKEARAILDKPKEEKRDLNKDEQEAYDEIMKEVDSLKKRIDIEEKQIGLEEDMKKPENEPAIKNKPTEPEEKRFKTFGEQLQAVMLASKPGRRSPIDSRLTETRDAPSGLNEGVGSEGGFLVQQDFASEILKRTYETGILASRVTTIPISANSDGVKINAVAETSRVTGSRWGGVQVYWSTEADTVTAKKPAFRQMELSLNKLMGLCYLTDELVKDTTALESIVTQAFTEEFGFMIDNAILNGTGAGQPLGIMNSAALISHTRSGAHAIASSDILGMWARFYAKNRAKAVWLINQAVEPALYTMTVGSYTSAFMPPGGLSGNMYATLMGRPVIPIEQTSSDLGTTSDIMLVDLSQYLMIDKGSLEQASSLHVRFLYDEKVFRFIYRVDGQPIWNSALTPFGSGNTLSPYVVLSTST